MKLVLIIISWSICFIGYGQKLDSLKSLAKLAQSDSERVRLYMEISNLWPEIDINGMSKYCDLAIIIDKKQLSGPLSASEKTYYSKNLAVSIGNLGFVYYEEGHFERAFLSYKKSITILKEITDTIELPVSYSNLGHIYQSRFDTVRAFENYFAALKYLKTAADQTLHLNTLNDIAYLYLKKNNLIESEKYYDATLSLSKKIEDKAGIYTALNYLGYLHSLKGDTTKAIDFYLQSLTLATKANDIFSMAVTYNDLGGIYRDKKNFKEAEINFKKGIKLLELSGNENDLTTLFRNYTKLFVAKGNLKDAEQYALKGMDYAIKSEDRNNVMKLAELLCTIYKAQPKKALEYCSLYEHLNDSINTLQINNQQLFEEYSKNYAQLEAEENKKNNAAQLTEKPIISTIGIYLVGGLVVFLIGLLLFLKRKKK